jgi:predicted Zn-dependent peptidase
MTRLPEAYEVQQDTLPNGLRVVMTRTRDIPTAAVAVYYDVGSRSEKPGRTGFAHLFEHMMFEGSENAPKTMHMKYISAAGGSMNGTTSEERTNYFEVLPSHMLPLGLWLEADRMRSLKITNENFENQRETVKEERRQSVDNQPYGEVWLKLRETALDNWSYSHPVIGSMDDLDAAHVEDAREFFRTYYAPNNAVLAVAGDIDYRGTLDLVQQYFADIPAADPPDPVDTSEPAQREEQNIAISDPKIALPGLVIAYKVPRRRHPDSYAIHLLKNILYDGRSSRIYNRVIEKEEAAIECMGYVENTRGPALFPMWFIAREPDTGRLKQIIDEEIGRIHDEGITERELQKARNGIKSAFLDKIEPCLGKALTIAEHKLYDDDPNLINTEIDRFLEVSLQQLNGAARTYLVPSNRTVLNVLPGSTPASPIEEEVKQ